MENSLLGIKMNKVLIIGHCGYLGSVLMKYLSEQSYIVYGIDKGYYSTNCGNSYDFNYIISSKYYSEYDTIILLAGHSSPSLCENDKLGSFKNNVTNFNNLISKLSEGQRLLYASSASVCNGLTNAYENDKLNAPFGDYDMQKQVIEKIAEIAKCETIGMRFGTIGGYSPNPRLDSVINSLYHDGVNKKEITISNGSNFRSYLGINDACKAIAALIEVENPYKIYNIASGTSTINYIGEKIAFLTGSKINDVGGSNRYSFWVNSSRINKLVQLTDTIESICEGMGDMVKADKSIYNRNTNLFKY
jgi:nucleoside-diphosphate-sugar epimerase